MKLYRHAPPNIYDQAPFGTHCIVIIKDKNDCGDPDNETYVQTSKDEERPRWEKL